MLNLPVGLSFSSKIGISIELILPEASNVSLQPFVSFASVFTNVPVKEHDLINDRMVEAVSVMRDVRGRIQGYEATLK